MNGIAMHPNGCYQVNQDDLDEIERVLSSSSQRMVIKGEEGIGKSSLANYYHYHFQKRYHTVFRAYCGHGMKEGLLLDIGPYFLADTEAFKSALKKRAWGPDVTSSFQVLLASLGEQKMPQRGLLILEEVREDELSTIPSFSNWDIIAITDGPSNMPSKGLAKNSAFVKLWECLRKAKAKESDKANLMEVLSMTNGRDYIVSFLARSTANLSDKQQLVWLIDYLDNQAITQRFSSLYIHSLSDLARAVLTKMPPFTEKEKGILALMLSLLPRPYSIEAIWRCHQSYWKASLSIGKPEDLASLLDQLYQKGWLERYFEGDNQAPAYFIHSMLRNVLFQYLEATLQDVVLNLGRLKDELEASQKTNSFRKALQYLRTLAIYADRFNYHQITPSDGQILQLGNKVAKHFRANFRATIGIPE